MKRFLAVACFTLVLVAAVTPQAHAQVRSFVGFQGGFSYWGGYNPYYGWGYPVPPAWAYPYSAYRYPFAVPYFSPFVTYGYIPPPRIYPQPLFRGYTLYPMQRRVYPVPNRVIRPERGYGGYVPRVYRRDR